MEWQKIREQAREKLQGICRLCPNCDGRACAGGEIPGMGGVGTGSSFINNYEALRKVRLNLSALHSITDPALEVEIFGRTLALPVWVPPWPELGSIFKDVSARKSFVCPRCKVRR